MVELTIRVEQSTMALPEARRESAITGSVSGKIRKLDRLVTVFRITVTIICSFIVLFAFASLLAVHKKVKETNKILQVHEAYSESIGVLFALTLFLSIGIVLACSIILLIVRLRKNKASMLEAGFTDVYQKEIRTLLIILIIFDFSFIMRVFADEIFLEIGLLPVKMLEYDCIDAD